jgi:aminomethyltransferase
MLRTTPFHPRTAPLNQLQNWRRWSGYYTAGLYEMSHEREYWAIRNAAALFDVSPLMKYLIEGPDAAKLLDRVVTRDVRKMTIGQVIYTPWCNAEGKVLDDGTISRLGETTFRMTSADPNLRWLNLNAVGMDVSITDISDQMAALSLQGPKSRIILNQCAAKPLDGLKYFRVMENSIAEVPVTISRTGYTGDLGYEVWIASESALPVWDALLTAGHDYGLAPAGILALDVARVEAGLILIETDYTAAHHALIEPQKSSPFELGLGWAVNLEKGPFNGKQALVAEKARGAEWLFVGLEVDWVGMERLFREVGLPPQISPLTLRASLPVFVGGVQVGYASSSTWSPVLKKYIALAHIKKPYYEIGTEVLLEVTVEHQRKYAPAKVVKTPFYEPEWKKSK